MYKYNLPSSEFENLFNGVPDEVIGTYKFVKELLLDVVDEGIFEMFNAYL